MHDMACTIVGTKKLHHFQPMSTSTLKFRHIQIKKVCNSEQLLKEEHINGYVSHCLIVLDVPSRRNYTLDIFHPMGLLLPMTKLGGWID
jgi:hypothetical protein